MVQCYHCGMICMIHIELGAQTSHQHCKAHVRARARPRTQTYTDTLSHLHERINLEFSIHFNVYGFFGETFWVSVALSHKSQMVAV